MSEIVVLKLRRRGEEVSAKKIIQSMVYVQEEFTKNMYIVLSVFSTST